MKTLSLQIRITSAHRRATVAAHEAPTHPAPLLFLDGACTVADQTEHVERAHKRHGDLFNVLTFTVAVSAPSLMSAADVAAEVERRLSFDFPPCPANAFWESIDVRVSPLRA
jgi:hypothetical protein